MSGDDSLPRVAHGKGPVPTHVHFIFTEMDGSFRIEIHEQGSWRSSWGFHRSLRCRDREAYDRQMEILLEARVPFMIGHVIPGPSDAAYYWLKEKGRPVDYLEIFMGGKTEWGVREIVDERESWRGARLSDLLRPAPDLFGDRPAGSSSASAAKPRGRPWVRRLSWMIPLVVLVATCWSATGVLKLEMLVHPLDLVWAAVRWGVAGGLAWSALCWLASRSAFRRPRDRAALVASSVAIGLLVAALGSGVVNVKRDGAPRGELRVVVVDKKVFKGRDGRARPEHWSHLLVVRSWRDGVSTLPARVTKDVFDRARPGATVTLHPHPGRLGWPWYSKEEMNEPGFAVIDGE